jgi:hypothetical protein
VRGKTCKEMLIRFGLEGATEIIEYIWRGHFCWGGCSFVNWATKGLQRVCNGYCSILVHLMY